VPVYEKTNPGLAYSLGFDHLLDELRNATNPASGLPRELLIDPKSLDRLSVPQAVERVAKINDWRAAQKVEASQAIANNPASHLLKEYPHSDAMPNPKGLRWVELKQPTELPEGWKQKPNGDFIMPDGKITSTGPSERSLQDALKYEGDTMGHCVGGYCDDVASGKSRIFSRRGTRGPVARPARLLGDGINVTAPHEDALDIVGRNRRKNDGTIRSELHRIAREQVRIEPIRNAILRNTHGVFTTPAETAKRTETKRCLGRRHLYFPLIGVELSRTAGPNC
jgi:hypothetical protein